MSWLYRIYLIVCLPKLPTNLPCLSRVEKKVVADYVIQTKEEENFILTCAMVVANHVNWRCL
jgi:hypothetical protein